MIYGKRIRLRKVERADLPRFVEWFNDPEVRRGVSMFLPISGDEETAWYEAMLKRPQEERALAVELREGESWRLVGNTGLFEFDWIARCAEFGLAIGDKSVWGQGIGTEVTRLVLQHGFETLNLKRIFLRVFANNPGAMRAYEKAGYVLEGRLRKHHFSHGQYVDVLLMGVLREEWEAARDA